MAIFRLIITEKSLVTTQLNKYNNINASLIYSAKQLSFKQKYKRFPKWVSLRLNSVAYFGGS